MAPTHTGAHMPLDPFTEHPRVFDLYYAFVHELYTYFEANQTCILEVPLFHLSLTLYLQST